MERRQENDIELLRVIQKANLSTISQAISIGVFFLCTNNI